MAKAHPRNAEGPFYVAVGDCIACGAPAEMAPDIFGWDDQCPPESAQCFIRNQPCTAEAIARIMHTMRVAEVECIRYRGSDPNVEAELDRQGLLHLHDAPSE